MVSIVVTAYERPEMLARAVDSALAQTVPCEIIVVDDSRVPWRPPQGVSYYHRARRDGCYLTWYEGIHIAQGEYVAILHDDDWYEPNFVETCLSLMRDDVAYAFTGALIHWDDGRIVCNWGPTWGEVPGLFDADRMAGSLMDMGGVISPSCALHRRADLLRNLLPGGVPGLSRSTACCGPDILLSLLPLLDYPLVGHTQKHLVHFTAHEMSTTIAEMAKDGGAALQVNYHSAKVLFAGLRELKKVMCNNDQCAV